MNTPFPFPAVSLPSRLWAGLAGIHGALGVAASAAAAHALAGDPGAASLVDTAARLQLVHAAALLALAALGGRHPRLEGLIGVAFALGAALFSGSLYAMGFLDAARAPLAPVGGTTLIVGWLALVAWAVIRRPAPPRAPGGV